MSFITKLLESGNINQAIYCCEYDPALYSKGLFTKNNIDRPRSLERWLVSRQAQFLAGRIAASTALSDVNCVQQNIAVGLNREPLWPENFTGSISHDKNRSIAVAIPHKSKGVGIDIQSILSDSDRVKLTDVILTKSDQTLFQGGIGNLSKNELATLIFSAKESFFKAVYKQVGCYFDFDAVSVIAINMASAKLTLISHDHLSNAIQAGDEFTLSFDFISDMQQKQVITFLMA